MSAFVHLIADYGEGDPAFSEVVHRLKARDPDLDVQITAVPPLSTVATGFWIEQLGRHNPAFDGLLVYSNTAPRTTETTPDRADEGGRLCYAELDNGVPVVAVDAGYNLSFVRDAIETFRDVEVPEEGSQFRSRDQFPQRVVEIARGETEALGPERSTDGIPAKPDAAVAHVDGYGNVKTTVRASEFDPEGDAVTVEIGDASGDAVVRDAVGEIPEGELGVVPGSAGGEDPYQELFLRGGSAAAVFDDPRPGDDVVIR